MPSTDGRSFTERLGSGWQRATTQLPLAAIPVLSSILDIDSVERMLSADGFSTGMVFRFPTALIDLWSFVRLPSQGPGLHPPDFTYLPVLVLVQSVLLAGYLGSVDEVRRRGGYDFWQNAKQYSGRILGYQLLVLVPMLVMVGVGFLGFGSPLEFALSGAVLLSVVGYLLLSYCFYAVPYLLVVRDTGLLTAFSWSLELATKGGPYARYAGGYLVVTAIVSLLVTTVVGLGAFGIVVGTALTAPLALALSFATTEFVADLTAS